MYPKYLLIFILLILAITGTVSGTIVTLNQSHGETWVKWEWTLSPGDYGAMENLIIYADGAVVGNYNLSNTSQVLIPTFYMISDLNPNEAHSFHMLLLDISKIPNEVIDQETLSVSTSVSGSYQYVVLAIAMLLFILALAAIRGRMGLIGLILNAGAVILLGYLAISSYSFNPALSTIAVLLAIIAVFPIVYFMYKLYESSQNWSE